MIAFVWLLAKPITDLVGSFVKPIAMVAILVFLDIQFQIGITQSVVDWGMTYMQDYFISEYTEGLL